MNPSERLVGETFIIRLWRENLNGAWHGQIVHVASRQSKYFGSLAQAHDFISRFAEGIDKPTGLLNEEGPNDKAKGLD